MLRAIFLLVLLSIPSSSLIAQSLLPSKAEDLSPSCSATPSLPSGQLVCQLYLKGFLDGLHAEPGSNRISTVCLPEEFSMDQIRRVVVKWLENHPEKLHWYVAQAVRVALEEAFPCKK